MSESTETAEKPKSRFTDIRQFAAGDRFVGFTTCLECGAGIFIDPEDRKNDIHPMAIHIEWHDELRHIFEALETVTARVLENDGETNKVVEANKAEFAKEVTDGDRQIQRTDDVQERRTVGADRPQGPRPGPVPGVHREGRGRGQGNAGGPRQQG